MLVPGRLENLHCRTLKELLQNRDHTTQIQKKRKKVIWAIKGF